MELPASLPDAPELTVRRPGTEDAAALAELINVADLEDYGFAEMDAEEIVGEMGRVDLETDAWLVEGPDRGAIAYAALRSRGGGMSWEGNVTVRPDWRGRGIGGELARLVEERGRERVPEAPNEVRVTLQGWIKGDHPPARTWAERRGYRVQRQFLRMAIELGAPPPAPAWPDGVSVRTFVPGQDERPTFDALEAAFADHWGHLPAVYEEWLPRTQAPSFDPSLWLLAIDGDEIVATATSSSGPDGGWVSGLGTRREWRGRGIARAILLETFGTFWRRGIRNVALGVDGQSLTGATRLYESAGMHVSARYDQVAKVLRDGVDPAVRELEG
jgi:mycothiol synthase